MMQHVWNYSIRLNITFNRNFDPCKEITNRILYPEYKLESHHMNNKSFRVGVFIFSFNEYLNLQKIKCGYDEQCIYQLWNEEFQFKHLLFTITRNFKINTSRPLDTIVRVRTPEYHPYESHMILRPSFFESGDPSVTIHCFMQHDDFHRRW